MANTATIQYVIPFVGTAQITPSVAAVGACTLTFTTDVQVLSAIPVTAQIDATLLFRARVTVATPGAPPVFDVAPRPPSTEAADRFPQPAYDPDRPGAVAPVQYRPGGVDYTGPGGAGV